MIKLPAANHYHHADDVTTIQALTSKRDGGQNFLDNVLPNGDGLVFGDRTAMGDALLDANAMLESLSGDEITSKVVLVVSDGRSNTGAALEDALAELLETERLTIHTVALGTDADVEDLSKLARDSGGTFWFARSPADVSVSAILPRAVAGIRGEADSVYFGHYLDRYSVSGSTTRDSLRNPSYRYCESTDNRFLRRSRRTYQPTSSLRRRSNGSRANALVNTSASWAFVSIFLTVILLSFA